MMLVWEMERMSDRPLSIVETVRLQADLVVPVVVIRMLDDREPLDDVAEYAMNEIMFDMSPDTALLCIALCGAGIAESISALPAAGGLKIQCAQIIEEYGPLWLAHGTHAESLDNATVRELLSFIPEDLESLRDLLDAALGEMEEDHCVAAILCDILSLQADHHRLLAEQELAKINIRRQSRPRVEFARRHGANVIPFPAHGQNGREAARRRN